MATKKEIKKEAKITFKCKVCGKQKNIEDMRTVTRFFPPLVVCPECERHVR
ncbi:MAG: hypothetical protein PHR43_04065 [Dehalococcoidales bacterium]|nr:hypothetical protein [Dehalococcoidales bacterium]